MAFLLGELAELAGELAGLGAEGGEIVVASGEAGGALAEGATAIGELDGVAAELAETENGVLAEGAELVEAEAQISAPSLASRIWSNKGKFGKFIFMEGAKGALFYGGMKAAEKLIAEGKELFKGARGRSDQAKALAAVKQMTEVVKKLKSITDDQYSWTKDHFTDAESYGYLEIRREHLKLMRYKLFVQKLAGLDVQRNAIAKSLGAALKAKDVQKILGILPSLKDYAAKALEVSKDIDENEGLMVMDGLNSHTSEVKEAVDLANKITV